MAAPENRTFKNDTQLKAIKWPPECSEPRLDWVDEHEAGLRFRITPKGKRTFVYRYFPIGSKTGKQVTLGTYPKYTLAEARDKVRDLRKIRDAGGDPKTDLKAERAATAAATQAKPAEGRPAAYTIKKLSQDWLDSVSTHKSHNTYKQYKRMVDVWIEPEFGHLAVTDIDPEDIAKLLGRVAARISPRTGKPTTVEANRLQSAISAMFSWCVEEMPTSSGLRVNPYYGRRKKGGKELPLRHKITIPDVPAVAGLIYAIRESDNDDITKTCLELIWRTGVRVVEARGFIRKECDLDSAEWIIPGERTKNGVPLPVMLPTQVVAMLEGYFDSQKIKKRGAVFPNDGRSDGFVGHEMLNRAMKALGDSGRLHIARHALTSWAKRARFDEDLRNRLTNHISAGIDATYTHADLNDEAREAWQQYSDEIDAELKKLKKKNSPNGD